MSTDTGEVVVHVDVANSRSADYRALVPEITEKFGSPAGNLYAYTDWRREPEESEKLMAALGFKMIHCPSWSNGNTKPKRSDDTILQRGIYETLMFQPYIKTLVLVGSDSDHLHCTSLAKLMGKRVIVMHDPEALGHIFSMGDFEFLAYPKSQRLAITSDERAEELRLFVKDVFLMTLNARPKPKYLTRNYLVTHMKDRSIEQVFDSVTTLVKEGAITEYAHFDETMGRTIEKALRLNCEHEMVTDALVMKGAKASHISGPTAQKGSAKS